MPRYLINNYILHNNDSIPKFNEENNELLKYIYFCSILNFFKLNINLLVYINIKMQIDSYLLSD